MYCQVLSRGFFTEMRTFFWRKAAANGQILSGSRKRARQDRRPRPSATPPSVFHLPREERCAYFCDFQLSISQDGTGLGQNGYRSYGISLGYYGNNDLGFI